MKMAIHSSTMLNQGQIKQSFFFVMCQSSISL